MIVRPYQPDDLSILTAINEASLPAVNSLTPPELGAIIAGSAATLVALDSDGRHEGFVVCLDQAADYDSRNFRWLQQQFERFYYVDRIALAPEARGRGRGEALYRSLLATLLEAGADGTVPLTCEVNERPPNPGSLRFHQRFGFTDVGRQDFGDKAVIYLARPLVLPTRKIST